MERCLRCESWPYTLRLGLAIAITLLIAFLCLAPGDNVPSINVPFVDKAVHFSMFAAFGFSWYLAIARRRLELVIVGAGAGYGMLLEVLQGSLQISRSFEWWDALANLCGVCAGVWLFRQLRP